MHSRQFLHSDVYTEILVVPNVLINSLTLNEDESTKKGECSGGSTESSSGGGDGDCGYRGVLVLTDESLLVYNSEENKMTSIFPLREVELVRLLDDEEDIDPLASYRLQVCCGLSWVILNKDFFVQIII